MGNKQQLIIALAIGSLFIQPAFAQTIDDHKRMLLNLCEGKWRGNFEMIEHCLNSQREALAKLQQHVSQPLPIELQAAMVNCGEKWLQPDGGRNWEMVEYCYSRQKEAYERLKR